jgi:hypothetical protein
MSFPLSLDKIQTLPCKASASYLFNNLSFSGTHFAFVHQNEAHLTLDITTLKKGVNNVKIVAKENSQITQVKWVNSNKGGSSVNNLVVTTQSHFQVLTKLNLIHPLIHHPLIHHQSSTHQSSMNQSFNQSFTHQSLPPIIRTPIIHTPIIHTPIIHTPIIHTNHPHQAPNTHTPTHSNTPINISPNNHNLLQIYEQDGSKALFTYSLPSSLDTSV